MKKRPTSVTVISWVLIVLGALSAISTVATINNPMVHDLMSKSPIPVAVQYAMTFVGLVIMIVSGVAMLKGCNWARFLYVVWSAIGFVVGFATSPMKAAMIPGLVVFVVITVFLFRPRATEYFVSSVSSHDAQRV